jgi:PmbA protein
MTNSETAKYINNEIQQNGAEKACCRISQSIKEEINVAQGKISLFRTTFDTDVQLTAIKNQKKGNLTINKLDKDAINQAVYDVINLAESSNADSANDISPEQPVKNFSAGPKNADKNKMYDRLQEYLDYLKTKYPQTIIEEINFDFTGCEEIFTNTNKVEFTSKTGSYTIGVMFTSKDGDKTTSFNSCSCKMLDLDKPLKDIGGMDRLIEQSIKQLETESIPQKFIGAIIITPECLVDLIHVVSAYLQDYYFISGNSVFKDKLNEIIADQRLTLSSLPIGNELVDGYFITPDGYEAQNSTIIENGKLKTFLLSQYAANKTKQQVSTNRGGCFVINAGDKTLAEMIKSTDQGVLLCRFSGGQPADNGDFSGVAKNSFYIEKGKIKYALSETMLSGNLVKMLKQIDSISREQNNDGFNLLPWIKFKEITISGK